MSFDELSSEEMSECNRNDGIRHRSAVTMALFDAIVYFVDNAFWKSKKGCPFASRLPTTQTGMKSGRRFRHEATACLSLFDTVVCLLCCAC